MSDRGQHRDVQGMYSQSGSIGMSVKAFVTETAGTTTSTAWKLNGRKAETALWLLKY